MRRFSSLVFLLFLFLCQPLLSVAAPLTGAEKARLFVDVMTPVFDMYLAGDFSPMKEGDRFTGFVVDEENEEARFEAQDFFKATGIKLTCTVARGVVAISVDESWDDAANDVVKEVHEWLALYLRGEEVEGGAQVVFRHVRFEFGKIYYEVRLDIRGERSNPAFTLGCYEKDRSRETAVFSKPGASWKVWNTEPEEGIYKPRVGVEFGLYKDDPADVFGIHRLEVTFVGSQPWLVFIPDLYPMWAGSEPEAGQQGYIKEVQGVFIDGEPFAPFAAAKKAQVKPLASPRQPAFPLDPMGLTTLKGGSTIRFDLITTLGEKVQVLFPLSRSQFTIAKAEELISRNRISPIITRVAQGDHDGVKKAMAAGENVNARAPNGATALGLAVKMKDPEMIRILGTAKDLNTEDKNREGDGYLHIAAHYYTGTSVLKALLDIGCDPDIRDKDGRTPLGRTVCYEGFGKIDLLLKAGADINASDKDGYTPLHHTVRNRYSSADETAYLIKQGADKNQRTKEGNTPLMVATNNQCWDHIKKLLDLNVSLSPKNNNGQNALAMAEAYRDSSDLTDMIPMLILADDEAVNKTRESYKNLAEMIEVKGFYFLGFKNTTSETVHVAIRLKDSDGDWVTRSWGKIEPGEKELLGRSTNGIFYFYAESESWVWKGTDNTRTISGKKYGMRELELDSDDRGEPYYYNLK